MREYRLSIALVLMLFLAACGREGAVPGTGAERGARVYSAYCIACHQADGEGLRGLYPPIRQTDWVEGDAGRLIRLVLYGMSGPIEVNGEQYNGVMPPHRHLSDDQIADVLTFVRRNFDNDAGEVTADEVFAVRQEVGRRGVWSPVELEAATGIPDSRSVE